MTAVNSHKRVHVTKERLEAVANAVIEMVLRKNRDYGDAWQKHGLVGILVRQSDKALRLDQLHPGVHALVVDETAEDTLADMLGYCLLGLLWCMDEDPGGWNEREWRFYFRENTHAE